MLTLSRHTNCWQPILADLALILFLVSAAALSASTGFGDEPPQTFADSSTGSAQNLAPAQALYRSGPGLQTMARWLEEQPRDPRATLTIIAEHAPGEAEQAWTEARALSASARALGVRSRVIIREGGTNAVHASLAYDQPLS